jgi:hypothetical protein
MPPEQRLAQVDLHLRRRIDVGGKFPTHLGWLLGFSFFLSL